MNSALRDIAARFQHYRFFVDEMRDGGGRMEIAVGGADGAIASELLTAFRELHIRLVLA